MNRNSWSNTRYQAAAATRQRSAARHASPRESLFCETVDIFNPVGPRIKVRHYHTVPLLWLALLCTGLALGAQAQEGQPFTNFVWVTQPVLELSPQSTWENGVGEGFRSSAQSITVSAGATYGFSAFGARQGHDLASPTVTCLAPLWARTTGTEAISKGDWNCSRERNSRRVVSGSWG